MARKKPVRLKEYGTDTLNPFLREAPRVLIHFGTDWCAPCKRLERVLTDLLEEGQLDLPVGKVNVEDEPDLARLHGVTKNPTLCLFENGQLVRSHLGYANPEQVATLLER